MTNLLAETIEAITHSGHTPEDIVFIGSGDGKFGIPWARFQTIADQEYDSGYGSAEVATDLTVVFSDGKKMWRSEYDGSEWWDYDAPSSVAYDPSLDNIAEVVGMYWPTVEALHEPEEQPRFRLKSHSEGV